MEEPQIFATARAFEYGFPYLIAGLAIAAAMLVGLFRIYQEHRRTREDDDDPPLFV